MELDFSLVSSVKDSILQTLDECGYTAEEAIPGLIQAIVCLTKNDPDTLLEVGDLLADGGVDETDR